MKNNLWTDSSLKISDVLEIFLDERFDLVWGNDCMLTLYVVGLECSFEWVNASSRYCYHSLGVIMSLQHYPLLSMLMTVRNVDNLVLLILLLC